MNGRIISDGTCAEDYCRVMPDQYCRDCQRWYCESHYVHGAGHAVTMQVRLPDTRQMRPKRRRTTFH